MIWQEWFRDQFLSTPSARRATLGQLALWRQLHISIHALREEGDLCDGLHHHLHRTDFYPRPPRGGRPKSNTNPEETSSISIHALREEGDRRRDGAAGARPNISIHALREEGDPALLLGRQQGVAISIHALREEGDRAFHTSVGELRRISIHALREEGDRWPS